MGVEVVPCDEPEETHTALKRHFWKDEARPERDQWILCERGGTGAPVPVRAPAVIDVAYLERQREWSNRSFGPARRTEGILQHIDKEQDEVRADPTSLEEWVDIAMLALDGARRAGHEPQEILDQFVVKQEMLLTRSYPDWRTLGEDEPIEHIREVAAG